MDHVPRLPLRPAGQRDEAPDEGDHQPDEHRDAELQGDAYELIQFWSVDGFTDIANGSSGYIPPGLYQLRETVTSFPDAASVAYLRGRGIRTVVVERRPHAVSWPENAPVLTNPLEGLGINREDQPDVILYHLQSQ